MLSVGGCVLPELQQIFGEQSGSGTNPGGHVTISFGTIVISGVEGPLEYFHTHLPHFRLCVSETLLPSDARGPGYSSLVRSPWNCCSQPGRQKEGKKTTTIIHFVFS